MTVPVSGIPNNNFANVFRVVESTRFLPTNLNGICMYAFKSTNGAYSWNNPLTIRPNDNTA